MSKEQLRYSIKKNSSSNNLLELPELPRPKSQTTLTSNNEKQNKAIKH